MVTRHLGGRLAGEPQRGTLAQADQQHPARHPRHLAGASRHPARPRRLMAPCPQPRPPGRASGMNHAAAAANGAANLTHRQPETITGGSSWP